MKNNSFHKLYYHFDTGKVYRREDLLLFSKSIDRDLAHLLEEGLVEKVAPGLYYKPKNSKYGSLPPKDSDLVKAFLKDDHFLIFSKNDYNSLGLGLTQLYNSMLVYNQKRHGIFQLAGKTYDFRRPARGFPKRLTPEFLLVDLYNNLQELIDEDNEALEAKFKNCPLEVLKRAHALAMVHGKVKTKKFFLRLMSSL